MMAKEAAEVIAKAVVEAAKSDPKPATSFTSGPLQEDEQWTLAAYMEGISEHQEYFDAKVRSSLEKAFNIMEDGLDKIDNAHKMALEGVEKQHEGLVMLRNVCANTPLYKVSAVFEDLLGQSVTEGDESDDKVSKEEAKKFIKKVVFPSPSVNPVRIFIDSKRRYQCPICKYVRVNREAVNAHIRQAHDNTKIGPCDGCGTYYTHNKESFLTHRASCVGTVSDPEVVSSDEN